MKNDEGLTARCKTQPKQATNGSHAHGYEKLIVRRCAHGESKIEPIRPLPEVPQKNGKPRSTFLTNGQTASAPSSPTKTYRPCCASPSPSSAQNSEKLCISEPSSPRRKGRVLLRQSALENSKLFDHHDHHVYDHEKLPKSINNTAKIPNRATTSKTHHISNGSSTTTATKSQTKSRKCNGNNGTTSTGDVGKVFRDSFTISSPKEVGQYRQRRGQNSHEDNQLNMTTMSINKDSKKAKMDSCNLRRQAVLKPSCVSPPTNSKPPSPPPPTRLQSTRKRLQAISPISTTTKVITFNTANTASGEQSRKLISRETTVLFLNVHGKNKIESQESSSTKNTLLTCSSPPSSYPASRTNGNSNPTRLTKVSTAPSSSGLGHSRTVSASKIKNINLDTKMDNGEINREKRVEGQHLIAFIEPLEPNLKFLEGSNLELTVKIQGAKKVVWVKNDKVVPNIPPDFEYKSNSADGTFSLKIQDAFIEDSGLYICEAYGSDEESDAICWCHVNVLEEIDEDDTTSIELEDIPEHQPVRRFIVPLIITSDASEDPNYHCHRSIIMEPGSPAGNKRLNFKEIRGMSANSSRDIFEDALEEQQNNSSDDHLQHNHMEVTDHRLQNDKSHVEEISDADESISSQSEVYLTANQSKLNGTDNELGNETCEDSINLNPEKKHPYNETFSVTDDNDLGGFDTTLDSQDRSFASSSLQEEADSSLLSSLGRSGLFDPQFNGEIEVQLSFSDDSLRTYTIFDSTPEIEPELNSFSDVEHYNAFEETLGSADMSISTTKSEVLGNSTSSALNSPDPTKTTYDLNKTRGFKDISFETMSETSEDLDTAQENKKELDKVFTETLGLADMSISTTTSGVQGNSTSSLLNNHDSTGTTYELNQTIESGDMSFETISELPEFSSSIISAGEPVRSPPISGKSFTSQSSTESGESEAFNSLSLEETLSSVGQSSPEVDGSISNRTRQLQSRDSLTDQLPPRILIGPSNLIAILGETVNLRVKIQSTDEANTTIGWCKFVRGIYRSLGPTSDPDESENSSSHVQIKKVNRDLITLSITDVNYEDSGKYRVKVQNLFGVDYHHCILSVEGPPEPPSTPPKAKYDQISNAILVSWHSCPYDGGSAVTGYCLEACWHPVDSPSESNGPGEDNWIVLPPPSFKWLCFTLDSPKPAHSYRFRVSVENAYGIGKPSRPSRALAINKNGFSAIDTGSFENPDRTVSLVYNYNLAFESTESAYEYKDVRLKNEPFLQHYDKFEQLGKGRFGVVFKVINKVSKKPYAGKFVKCIKAKDKERAQLECKIMNELKYHPKLICLVDAFEMPREIVIVTEMISGGELFERVVADDFTLTEHDCIAFLRQICDGVNYIHQNNIMHLDLKPENILCTTKTSNQIKIIDFGLAQHYNPDDPISVLFGTAEFVGPEIVSFETISPLTDMWAIGIITYILLSGLSPFLGENDNETFSNITRGEFDFEDDAFDQISEDAKDFISNLIIKRKEKRLTAMQCLQHQWLALSDAEKKDIILPTEKLKRFLVRRKWQKTGNAIRALGRITTLYSSRKSSSASSSTSSSCPFGSSFHRILSTQDSTECDSVFGSMDPPASPDLNVGINPLNNNELGSGSNTVVSSPTSKNQPLQVDNLSETINTNKPKYNDSSRSDSGVCDVVTSPATTPTPLE